VCCWISISQASRNNLSILVVYRADVKNVKSNAAGPTSTSNGPHASLVCSNGFKCFVSNSTVGAVQNAVAAGEQRCVASNWGNSSQFWVVLQNVVRKWFFLILPRDYGSWAEVADRNGNTINCKDLHDWKLMKYFTKKWGYFKSEQWALLAGKCFCWIRCCLIFSSLYIVLQIEIIWRGSNW